jgi:NAD-dependent SIR2 family protein deacetylase
METGCSAAQKPAVAVEPRIGDTGRLMSFDPEILRHAAEAIRSAEGLVIVAGADMELDSGIPALRGDEDLWRQYPVLAGAGLSLENVNDSQWFLRDGPAAWGFWGSRLEWFRRTAPHAGYARLRAWAETKPEGAFVVTSNGDGQFQKAGFPDERVFEATGSMEHLQCAQPCCAASWPAPPELTLAIDPATLRAQGELPRCVRCGKAARPNLLTDSEAAWSASRATMQQVLFRAWVRNLSRGAFVVIELGTDEDDLAVRPIAEQLAGAARVALVRITARENTAPPNVTLLTGGVAATLAEIASVPE